MIPIAEYIHELRIGKGLSQTQVAAEFVKRGYHVSNRSISFWETGRNQLNAEQFLVLCDILGISDIRTAFRRDEVPTLSTGLNEEGQQKLSEYASLLKASGLYQPAEVIPISSRLMKRYLLPVSAGTGQFLDDDAYDEIEVGSEVPEIADFGVTISGDSMHPRFIDGQTVWVHEQEELSEGEIGIFFYAGNAYIKKLGYTGDIMVLLSLNPAYEPIQIQENEEFKVFGKVVG